MFTRARPWAGRALRQNKPSQTGCLVRPSAPSSQACVVDGMDTQIDFESCRSVAGTLVGRLDFSPVLTSAGFETMNDTVLREMNERARSQLSASDPPSMDSASQSHRSEEVAGPRHELAADGSGAGKPASEADVPDKLAQDSPQHLLPPLPFEQYRRVTRSPPPTRFSAAHSRMFANSAPLVASPTAKRVSSGEESPTKRQRVPGGSVSASPTKPLQQLSLDTKDRLAQVSAARRRERQKRERQTSPRRRARAAPNTTALPLPHLNFTPDLRPSEAVRDAEPLKDDKLSRESTTPVLPGAFPGMFQDKLADVPKAEPVSQRPLPHRPLPHRPLPQQPLPQQPLSQRPLSQRPVSQRPVSQRPLSASISTRNIPNLRGPVVSEKKPDGLTGTTKKAPTRARRLPAETPRSLMGTQTKGLTGILAAAPKPPIGAPTEAQTGSPTRPRTRTEAVLAKAPKAPITQPATVPPTKESTEASRGPPPRSHSARQLPRSQSLRIPHRDVESPESSNVPSFARPTKAALRRSESMQIDAKLNSGRRR